MHSKDLESCLKEIENQLGWGDASTWSSQDFISLSERIFEITGTQLSQTTLKRVWGKVKYDSSPTATTLNTLAVFLGYENWRVYVNENSASLIDKPTSSPKRKKIPTLAVVLGGAVLFMAVFASLLGLTLFFRKLRLYRRLQLYF